ncbi:hypothetical protein L6164_002472 [Bauhinia variegata]|uniref:Uncharacterized protein n=1 Tax=Bauhinia variegata TaxID=167791 RepID=A0ACB9PZS7_BAUVA|nr:hypothetical protein L6164_002472 [Bauhinia variegata]
MLLRSLRTSQPVSFLISSPTLFIEDTNSTTFKQKNIWVLNFVPFACDPDLLQIHRVLFSGLPFMIFSTAG